MDVKMNPQQDLIIGEDDPDEEVTITGEYFLDGNIIILNQGTLNLIDADFSLKGNIFLLDSAQFNIRSGLFTALAEYIYQYLICGLDNSTTMLDSTPILVPISSGLPSLIPVRPPFHFLTGTMSQTFLFLL